MTESTDIPPIICVECGKVENGHWMESMMKELQNRQLCFYCNFWYNKTQLAIERPLDVVRIRGIHYVIEPDTDGGFRGYGGTPWTVTFKDGRVVKTRNLWHQGDIPEIWQSRLPDNAESLVSH